MEKYCLKPEVAQAAAVETMHEHIANWISKWFNGKKKLRSIEMVFLPYYIFPYQLQSRSLNETIDGLIGIETYESHSVILPVEQRLDELKAGVPVLPIGEEANPKLAYDAVYSEAFIKEKRRSSIRLEVGSPFLLYVPYWIGYLKGKETDMLVIDGLSGKIDIKLKDSVMKAFLKEAELQSKPTGAETGVI